jgi:flagellar hook-associated protein 3 FlgL
MTRISTLAQHSLTQSQISSTQKRLQELQVQLSTGQKSLRYSGIAAESSRLVNLESSRMRTDQYLSSNNALTLRSQTMELSVAKTFDVASELKTLLVNAINSGNATDLPLSLTANNMMDEVARALNVKLGDRYLFSGTATSTVPVDFDDTDFITPPSSYPSNSDTSYFQGNSTRLSARVADDFDVSWGATADEEGFEQLIRALHLTATATTSPPDTIRLEEALSIVNQAIDNIPEIRSRIAAAQKSIETANSSHADINLYLDETITDIKAVDIPMTVTRLANDQTVLEASFMTVSRLSQLTLATFLR